MATFMINGKTMTAEVENDTPLLWVIRDELGLTGTKFGCGIGSCGACTVHVGGIATRSCITPVEAVEGSSITTIEGLSSLGDHPVQVAWQQLQVPQCGYCQSGQIMQAVALLKSIPNPSDEDIDAVMSGNLCRCMTYVRIRQAIHDVAAVTSVEAAPTASNAVASNAVASNAVASNAVASNAAASTVAASNAVASNAAASTVAASTVAASTVAIHTVDSQENNDA
jgi:isoquinoline 1-oxidoreductase subunit alpha